MENKTCLDCGKDFGTRDKRQKFCNRTCSGHYNNLNRIVTEETKAKLSNSVKKAWADGKYGEEYKQRHVEAVGKGTKGKFGNPKNLFEVSTRTKSKILKRLGMPCSRCGWDKAICDIHHINGKKIENANHHSNLTYLCPNCHREAHNNLIDRDDLINLDEYMGDKWVEQYYG